MQVKLKSFLPMLMALFMFLSPLSVYAEDGRSEVDAIISLGQGQAEISKICNMANEVAGDDILVYDGADGTLSFSNKKYSRLTIEEKNNFMEVALNSTRDSGIGSQIKNKMYNFISQQDEGVAKTVQLLKDDVSADFAEASRWFRPFGSLAGVIMGFFALLTFMFLGLGIVIDLAYMNIPFFQGLFGDGGKPKFVSVEAYNAIRNAESGIGSDNYTWVYLKKKTISIFCLAIALIYLVSGQLFDLVGWVVDTAQTIIG